MDLQKYSLTFGEHNNSKVIWLSFPYDKELIRELKQLLPTAKWSNTQKKWHITDCRNYRALLGLSETFELSMRQASQINSANQKAYEKFIEQMQLKGYSIKTIKTYSN